LQLWLGQLGDEMKNTLQALLIKCLEETKKSDSGADLSTFPSQILCLSEEITFTQQCESAISSGRLSSLKTSLKVKLFFNLNMFFKLRVFRRG